MPVSAKSLMASLEPVSTEAEPVLGPTTKPGTANMDNPTLGDHAFYTYLIPGAVFEAKDGTQWDIEHIADTGFIRIRNRWYPREELTIPTQRVRETIHAWVEPVQQLVPSLEPSTK